MEKWKDLGVVKDINYRGYYQVSDLGRVKSLNYRRTGKEAILSQTIQNNGYCNIDLQIHNVRKKHLVHRLVSSAFIRNPNGKEMVNHKNGIKTDNRLENLEWCTKSENEKHAYRELGKKSSFQTNNPRCWKGKFGSEHNTSKTILQCDQEGNTIKKWGSLIEASRGIGLNGTTGISKALKGQRKNAGGYIWKYKDI